MDDRIDMATALIRASAKQLYAAFERADALEQWLAPPGMRGTMLDFDFRAGGGYRMCLTYEDGAGDGKTTADSDDVTVRLTRLEPARLIEQEVDFASDDPAFAGTMRMSWSFDEGSGGTLVTVRATDVPEGIDAAQHRQGMAASLAKLAAFIQPASF